MQTEARELSPIRLGSIAASGQKQLYTRCKY